MHSRLAAEWEKMSFKWRYCFHCGTSLLPGVRSDTKFCGGTCRMANWRAQARAVHRRALAQNDETFLRFIIGTSAERQKIVSDLVQRLGDDDPQVLQLAALALAKEDLN